MSSPADPGPGHADTPAAGDERFCPSCERTFTSLGDRCPTDGTRLVVLAAGQDDLIGRELDGRYTVLEKLGAGGMGAVYRGLQHAVGREVAIKVVAPRLVAEPDVIKRFLREAKLASRLSHPNAVAMLDFGQTSERLFYLVMELLVGRTLDKVLREEGPLPLPRLVRIGRQIASALDGAHRAAIVHRDLKPGNVMLLDGAPGEDLVKVLDFGLAKSLSLDTTSTSMTGSGVVLGTPAYMSPEAALGREIDARGDLYSLGCMLYVMACGRLPFTATTTSELVSKHAHEAPAPVMGVTRPVAAVIMRLLEKDPGARYQSAAEVHRALELAAKDRVTVPPDGARVTRPGEIGTEATLSPAAAAPAPTPAVSATPGKRRPRWPLAAAAVLVGGGIALWQLGGGGRDGGAGAASGEAAAPTSDAAPTSGVAPAATDVPPVATAPAPAATAPAPAATVPAPAATDVPPPPRTDRGHGDDHRHRAGRHDASDRHRAAPPDARPPAVAPPPAPPDARAAARPSDAGLPF